MNTSLLTRFCSGNRKPLYRAHRRTHLQNRNATGLEDEVPFHSRGALPASHLLKASISPWQMAPGTPSPRALGLTGHS